MKSLSGPNRFKRLGKLLRGKLPGSNATVVFGFCSILDNDPEPLTPDASIGRVTRMLATYNLVGVPVVDEDGRLLGAVTVDDVLDHILPEDWREERHEVTHGP